MQSAFYNLARKQEPPQEVHVVRCLKQDIKSNRAELITLSARHGE